MRIKAKPITEQEYMKEIAEAKIQIALDKWDRSTYPLVHSETEIKPKK